MLCHSSVCSRGGFNHGIIHVNSRFRRDARALEEEEETWFEQEDENGEEAVVVEQSDLLNDEHVFKNRKGFANEKPPPSLINNKRVSEWCGMHPCVNNCCLSVDEGAAEKIVRLQWLERCEGRWFDYYLEL